MRINPDRIIGFIVISLALAAGVVLILISWTYQHKLDILWRRYDDTELAKKLALVLGVALVVGAVLFFLSSACWLWIFDSADEKKKRRHRKAMQKRRLAKAKSQERQASSDQGRGPGGVEAGEVHPLGAAPGASPGGTRRPQPSCPAAPPPPENLNMAAEVHEPLMYSTVRDPLHGPPPYESVIMQECMKFPFADEV